MISYLLIFFIPNCTPRGKKKITISIKKLVLMYKLLLRWDYQNINQHWDKVIHFLGAALIYKLEVTSRQTEACDGDMCKQHNSSSVAQLSELSRASDRWQHFNTPFTHLHHAVFYSHPTIQVAMFFTSHIYPFTVTTKSDHCRKTSVSLHNTLESWHSKNTTVNISELLKAI